MRSIKFIIIIAATLLFSACSTTTDPAELYKDESARQIFLKGEEALRNRNYSEAIKRFEALDVQYPFGCDTEIAELHLIYAYYMSSDYASAESAADRFIRSHPANPHVDYAYYMLGLSNYFQNMGVFERLFTVDLAKRDLCQVKKAFWNFSQIILVYPQSCYAPSAYQYMIYLKNILAAHQLEVAQYYYSRQAYLAAANRASIVVRHYQRTPAVPCALAIMVNSYRQLNLIANANEAYEVLRLNYPSWIKVH